MLQIDDNNLRSKAQPSSAAAAAAVQLRNREERFGEGACGRKGRRLDNIWA